MKWKECGSKPSLPNSRNHGAGSDLAGATEENHGKPEPLSRTSVEVGPLRIQERSVIALGGLCDVIHDSQ